MSASLPIAPTESREVVKCAICGLVQFLLPMGLCRRCRKSVNGEHVPAHAIEKVPRMALLNPARVPDFGFAIRVLRQAMGLSQTKLARRMGCQRTRINKLENRKAVPNFRTIGRLAAALEVPAVVLVTFATFHMYYPIPKERPA